MTAMTTEQANEVRFAIDHAETAIVHFRASKGEYAYVRETTQERLAKVASTKDVQTLLARLEDVRRTQYTYLRSRKRTEAMRRNCSEARHSLELAKVRIIRGE